MNHDDDDDRAPPTRSPRPRAHPRPQSRPETENLVRRLKNPLGKFQRSQNIVLDIPARKVTAVMGPSGCGKSDFLRCLNRMHEQTPGATATGTVRLGTIRTSTTGPSIPCASAAAST